jgi:chemotaxis protein methyltransferase CheR
MLGAELTEEELARFQELIYRVAGIRIPSTKRVMVTNRLRRRLRATGIASFTGYYKFLTSPLGGGEMPLFLNEITTNETYFFRDPHHYEWFGDTFLPEIIQQARLHQRPRTLRVWSAACSTGEELYSLALKIQARRAQLAGWRITLMGTDLSEAVLKAARAGCYDARALRLVPRDDQQLYFDSDLSTQRWTLKTEIRSLATWRLHNLLEPLNVEPFDCVFLKNVLIYFDANSKQTVVKNILPMVAKKGYLVVGSTEGIYSMLGSLTRRKTWLYQSPA